VDPTLLEQCRQIINYEFKDPALLELALTHASVASNRLLSNERLEFLGDAILGFVVCHELYDSHEELLEGEMTQIKSSVVSRRTCALVAQETGICNLLLLGKGMGGARALPESVSAAVFESIIGAIYLDGGMKAARKFTLDHLGDHIAEAEANEHQRNYKSLLQQHSQRRWSATPEYRLLDEKGPDHSKCFEVAVAVNGKHFSSAWGRNKKLAEQAAARLALKEMGLLDEDSPSGSPEKGN